MKLKIALPVIAAMLALDLTAGSVYSETPVIQKAIRKSVHYPAFAKKSGMEGVIVVKYQVNTDGRVAVLAIQGSNDDLAAYVKQQLETLTFTDLRAVGEHYARFTFKLKEH